MYSKILLVILVYFSTSAKNVQSANILFLMGTPSPSHHIWNKVIVEKLHSNGHNLTILSPDEEMSKPGLTYILMENVYKKLENHFDGHDFRQPENAFQIITTMYGFYNDATKYMLESQGVQQLLNYPRNFKFETVIFDFTMTQSLLGFVEYFGNPPLISISPFNILSHTPLVVDAPLYTSYMPHFTGDFGPNMNFMERIRNSLYWAFDLFYRAKVYMRNENRKAKLRFGQNLTNLEDIERKTDLVLANFDFSMDYYRPLPPNVIPVGGLQVKRADPMLPVVKEFIARANKGVVLLSFGTNLQSDVLGTDTNQMILEVFRSMPEYSFIWKNDDPKIKILPHNVLILPWVPQNSILASSKTKLFITHGGLLSIQEATWNGVPMIGVPFFVDQHQNVDKIVRGGVGERISVSEFSKENLTTKIKKVLEEKSLANNMKRRSKIFRNQPEAPLDRAIFWIEKTIENKGLDYLRSPSIDMPFYKIFMLDAAALVILIYLSYVFVIKRCFATPKEEEKVKKA